MVKVVDAFGIDYLQQPEKLKSLLCPVIAQSPADQNRFYQVYDQYIKDIKPASVNNKSENKSIKIPNWVWQILAGLLAFGIYKYAFDTTPPIEETIIYHQLENEEVKLGDTLRVFNKSTNLRDSSKMAFYWEMMDVNSNQVEFIDSLNYDWELPILSLGNSSQKKVRLVGLDLETNEKKVSAYTDLTILCNNPPKLEILDVPTQISNDTSIEFEAKLLDDRIYDLSWNLGTATKKGKIVNHQFNNIGAHEVILTATIEEDGVCITTLNKTITVGSEKPPLELMALEKDKILPMAVIGEGMWFLIGLLSLLALWHWWKWWRKESDDLEQLDEEKRYATLFKVSNNTPYFIPFRPQNKLIKAEQSLYLFANLLRQRQEGNRESIDIQGTINNTIESGGFPDVKTYFNQKPTEYLVLLDEQADVSIQAKLFDYLVDFIKQNDVIVERFWYKNEFHHFWNENNPDGVNLDVLFRKYGHYRLLLMGDAHLLIDPFAQPIPKIKTKLYSTFSKFKERILFTPLPTVSWTYREGLLYNLFSVFPANIGGIENALEHDYSERDENLQPSFDNWKEQSLKTNTLPDINYRKWRRKKDFKAYLKDHPGLYTWLCGLAVYPNPTWETTIGIGKALETKGVKVTYDNLLILSHIPFLKGEIFKQGIRKILLGDLEEDSINLARQAIKTELEAVQEQVANSHANLEVQTNLAIQNFTLESSNNKYIEQIRYLRDNQLFNKKQLEELDWEAQKIAKAIPKELSGLKGNKGEFYDDINELLNEKELKPQKAKISPYKASIFTLIPILLLIFSLWSNKTDWLYEKAFGVDRATAVREDFQEMKNYFLVKELAEIDSAIIKNNLAVEFWNQNNAISQEEAFEVSGKLLKESMDINPNYELAKVNFERVRFNYPVLHYLDFRAENNTESLVKAKDVFSDSFNIRPIYIDALHAKGIINHYLTPDSNFALNYHNSIVKENEVYFDTINITPHLRDLLAYKLNIINFKGKIVNADNGSTLNGVGIKISEESSIYSNEEGVFEFSLSKEVLPKALNIFIEETGYETYLNKVTLNENSGFLTIKLKPQPQQVLEENKIAGFITDITTKKAIKAVKVSFYIGNRLEETISNEDGAFEFNYILNKQVITKSKLTFQKENYETFLIDNQIQSDSSILKISLTPISEINLDSDEDGIPDFRDKCPKEKGNLENEGCPPVVLNNLPPSKPELDSKNNDKALFFVTTEYDYWVDFPQSTIQQVELIAREIETNYSFQTEVIYNATREEILDKLISYQKMSFNNKDQLLVYFSQHGYFDSQSNTGALVPKDGLLNDPYYESFIGYPLLEDFIDRIPCNHILLFLDACYSGTFDEERGIPHIPIWEKEEDCKIKKEDALKYKSRIHFTSSSKEKTPAVSQIADKFLEALRTEDSDGFLSSREIFEVLNESTPRPRYGSFNNHEVGGDFIFIRESACPDEASSAQQQNKEEQLWMSTLQANTIEAYRTYLNLYPNGKYSVQANSKLNKPSPLNLASDFNFFEKKAKLYQRWLNSKGMGEILKVDKVEMKKNGMELELFLSLKTTDPDSAAALWIGLEQRVDSINGNKSLDEILYSTFTRMMEIPSAQGNIQVYFPRKEGMGYNPCFYVWLWEENEKIVSETRTNNCRSQALDLVLNIPKLNNISTSGEIIIYRKTNTQDIFNRINTYISNKLEIRKPECENRVPRVDILNFSQSSLKLSVNDLCNEILTNESKSMWCNLVEQLWGPCNDKRRERLEFSFEVQPINDDNGYILKYELSGKYGSGVYRPRVSGYMDMEPDFVEYISLYLEKFIKDLRPELERK